MLRYLGVFLSCDLTDIVRGLAKVYFPLLEYMRRYVCVVSVLENCHIIQLASLMASVSFI